MQDIVGTELLTAQGMKPLAEALPATVKCVGFYFGAHWAPCCRRFQDTLRTKYGEINASSKEFEVIFVSKDGNQNHFDMNFANHPWLAIKYDDEARKKSLEQKFGIMEIPKLIICDPQGKQISENGVADLNTHQSDAIVEAWEKMASNAEAEAANAGAAAQQ